MAEIRRPRVLHLLQGGLSAPAEVQRRACRTPLQLGLPMVEQPRARLVSVGWDAIEYDQFVDLLLATRPSRLVDIRVSPSFQTRGFNRDRVAELLQKLHVSYAHIRELANVYVGEHLNPAVALEQFSVHVAAQPESLRLLRDWVTAGPLLLLGRSRCHAPSERSIVVEALARLDPAFTLVVADA